jgi:hypothetical protein
MAERIDGGMPRGPLPRQRIRCKPNKLAAVVRNTIARRCGMSCEGYEHGQRVYAVRRISDHGIPRGTAGVIVDIHSERHTIDVRFAKFGLLKELDAHSFTAEAEEPPPAVSAM